jgi:hypothetical protein
MGMNRWAFTWIIFFPAVLLTAQYDHEQVLPGLTGGELLEQLEGNYKPDTVLDFGDAKDVLYGTIYFLDDSVRCVYSGHALYLDPGADPSQYLYLDGSNDGINLEHTYPQSKGAGSGNARSDLYNLYPTRLQVNADRGNLAFGEIPDQATDFWYYKTIKQTQVPSTNIQAYSEATEALFEPREDHKGNVARSVFYFVTMYGAEVDAADPAFFESMRQDLCDWHYADPVDSLEWVRNIQIAGYQSGRPNPFILDCSLAGRTYCDYIDEGCTAVGADHAVLNDGQTEGMTIYPNPFSSAFSLVPEKGTSLIQLVVYNLLGEVVYHQDPAVPSLRPADFSGFRINLEQLPDGIYVVRAMFAGQGTGLRLSQEVLVKKASF